LNFTIVIMARVEKLVMGALTKRESADNTSFSDSDYSPNIQTCE
jgi:hypothetical protein